MMNVIRLRSAFRFRISFAARPTATRSRDSSNSSASWSEMRSPSSAFSRTSVTVTSHSRTGAWHRLGPGRGSRGHHLPDEAELGYLLQLPGVAGELEERHQAGALPG